jgi:mannosyltransferase
MKPINYKNIFLLLLFVSAVALRIFDIDAKNMWFDEIYSWKISNGSIVKIISETAGDIHPPLFYIVLKCWTFIFSDSIISMRMLSVILSIISMFVLYFITSKLLPNEIQRLLVLLLFALSPLNIFYSQEVRMLNLNLLLTLTSVYFFIRYFSTPKGIFGALYCITVTLSLYTHYFALFILIAQLIYAGLIYLTDKNSRDRLRPFFKYPAFAFAMFIPWLPIMVGQAIKGQPWRKSQSVQQVFTEVFNYFKDVFLSPYFTYESMTIMYLSHLISILTMLFLLLCIIRIFNTGRFLIEPADVSILLFFIPLILAVFVSFRQSIVFSRYLSIIIPYLLILLVYFSFRFYKQRTAIVMSMLFVSISFLGIMINYGNDFKNNDYRKIISYIDANKSENDKLIVEPHFMGWAIDYHNMHSSSPIPKPNTLGWNMSMQIDSLSKSKDFEKLWFVLDYSSMDKSQYDFLADNMAVLGYDEVSEKTFYLIPEKVKVHLFESTKHKSNR